MTDTTMTDPTMTDRALTPAQTEPRPRRSRMISVRGVKAALATGVVLVTSVLMPATPAFAASRDGHCDAGEFCLYYNSNQAGSVSDFTGSISDYGSTQPSCYDFKGAGNGKGVCVKNNAASVWNRTSGPVTVFFNSGYGGASQTIASGGKANLSTKLKNENASHKFGAVTSRTNMSSALYGLSGGRITCGFDKYVNTPGRHEGIDIARGIGSPVRALVAGKVVNIVRGASGGSGLSTIAIYNSTYDKTIVYLHSAPLSGLSVGQSISKGQKIATESWRGISSSSSAHTHVEMRLGKRTLAAKSVGDSHLDNPNPTSFWNARGYTVK